MTLRMAGAICHQGHLDHRTLLEARRCDVEWAERAAIWRYERRRKPGFWALIFRAFRTLVRPTISL